MQQFLVRLVVIGLTVLLTARLFDAQIDVESLETSVYFILVLGVCNAVARPLLLLIALPLNVLTLGLFTILINGFVFWLATLFPLGVRVYGPSGAIVGALCVSTASLVAGVMMRRNG